MVKNGWFSRRKNMKKIVYLDFDGTVVEHKYPSIGRFNPNAINCIGRLQKSGWEIVFNTLRVEFRNGTYEQALNYLNTQLTQLYFTPVTEHTNFKIHPTVWDLDIHIGSESEDFKRILCIDDQAYGIPLRKNVELSSGLMVDWVEVERQLVEKKLINRK